MKWFRPGRPERAGWRILYVFLGAILGLAAGGSVVAIFVKVVSGS